jgi:hypothetical protein
MSVIYIENPENFDEIWNLVSDDPDYCDIDDEIISLLPQEVMFNLSYNKLSPSGYYLLISRGESVRVIGFDSDSIKKHTIGEDPLCWNYAAVSGPINCDSGPIYVISDIDLLNKGIMDLILNYRNHTKEYQEIIQDELKLGDMVHIPVYDYYSKDHYDIYFHILIYNGKELVRAEEISNYGSITPKETPFPMFPLEHFTPLGRSGGLLEEFRWVTSEVVEQYNNAPTLMMSYDDHVKELIINNERYYFVGDEKYPVQMTQIEIVDSSDDVYVECDEYVLMFH